MTNPSNPERAAPELRGGRWWPGPEDLAAAFGVDALPGLFQKSLSLPTGMRAWILNAGQATEVGQGEHELESFFSRLNHLLRGQGGSVLVARSTPLALPFALAGLPSCEGLALLAQVQVSVRVEQVPVFARHFMAAQGVIGRAELQDLLGPSVRQLALEFIGSQSLREMQRNPDLRAQFEERLHSGLKQRLSQFGLAIASVDTLELQHQRADGASAYLVAGQRVAQARELDQLYDEDDWRRIEKEGRALRVRQKRGELALEQGEAVQALRLRAIELYGRVAEARSRKHALERGAAEALAEIDHQLAERGAARLRDEDRWEQVRQLARLRQRTEIELARREGMAAIERAQQEMHQRLQRQQLDFRLAEAEKVDDAVRQRALREAVHGEALALARQGADLAEEQRRARLALAAFEHAAREREAERLLAWQAALGEQRLRELEREDQLAGLAARERQQEVAERIADQERGGRAREAAAQHEKLLRTLEAEARFHANQADLERARWQNGQDSLLAQQAHAAEMARIEIARVEALGRIEAERLQALGQLGVAPLAPKAKDE